MIRTPMNKAVTQKVLRSGVGRVIAFNWPKYVVAVLTLIGLASFSIRSDGAVHLIALAGLLALIYGVLASLVATWWAYDHEAANLYETIAHHHRQHCLPNSPDSVNRKWILVHAGLDESQGRLNDLIGEPLNVFDVGPTQQMTRSLRRAHAVIPRTGQIIKPTTNYATDLPTGSVDTAVVLFGIHEVRNNQHASLLLGELSRVVRPAGSILIVEHLRDVQNITVYGPAVLHFGSARHWKRVIANSSLHIRSAERIAGLINIFDVNHA
jgi:hypothetical protein